MLKFRTEHWTAMQRPEEGFVTWMVLQLRAEYAEIVSRVSDEQLTELVMLGLARARAYGFQDRKTLASFVFTMFSIAPNFDEHPKVHAILTDPRLPEDAKFNELLSRTTDEDWQQARANLDQRAWSRPPRFAVQPDPKRS